MQLWLSSPASPSYSPCSLSIVGIHWLKQVHHQWTYVTQIMSHQYLHTKKTSMVARSWRGTREARVDNL
ncbi:hypothetical protein PFLUV_G00227570 [Perca fluviatilis]|uniref:Uncharacterized protein n=1 Tax=Perca fluviatilis TaxID=8168 RepID=A0A6A5E0X0_PERFL|nr:hypothetical protein PFLUV_G00227570 [Perca fluviatilis]